MTRFLSKFSLFAALFLVGCADAPAVKPSCLPLPTYSAEEVVGMVKEVTSAELSGKAMPNTEKMLGDYSTMRENDRACIEKEKKN